MKNFELEIKKLDINGHGLGYYNKKLVFVPYALPTEVVKVEVVKEHYNYIEAKLIDIVKRSKDRVKPTCKIFNKCGGCSLMHLSYEEQLKYKKHTVIDTFKKYADVNVKIDRVIGSEQTFKYRNKVSLVVKRSNHRVILGLYEEGTHYIVDYSDCLVQDPLLNETIKKIRLAIEKSNIMCGDAGLKNIILRRSNINEDMQLTLVFGEKKNTKIILEHLLEIPNIVSIHENINTTKKGVLMGKESTKLFGNNSIKNVLGDKIFRLGPTDFFQLNSHQVEKLYDVVKEFAEGSKSVVDCYGGVGTIGQYITSTNLRGIEINRQAVKNANENCSINKVSSDLQKAYHAGEVGEVLKKWCKDGYKPDTMIFDPPRVGLDKDSIDSILKVKPDKVIYISCNPSTLAKNYNELKRYYKLKKVVVVDMFSHTAHVETVVLMSRLEK